MKTIGVRELRQHASRYLDRVAGGESLEVTNRGRPVAMLVPVRGDEWDALLASGRVTVPTDEGDIVDEAPSDFAVDASRQLATMRQEER